MKGKSSIKTADNSRQLAFTAANILEEKKGKGTLVLDVRQVTLLADYLVIGSGETNAQVKAMMETIDKVATEKGQKPRQIEGKTDGRWILMDFGDVIVHILQEKARSYYKLEQFWNHALIVDRGQWLET